VVGSNHEVPNELIRLTCSPPSVPDTASSVSLKPCGWLSINSAKPIPTACVSGFPSWYERYGPRAEAFRLPKDASKREVLAVEIGTQGYALLDAVFGSEEAAGLRDLPTLEVMRQGWLQLYYRCTAPGFEDVRWRGQDERPPSARRLSSPHDPEARYSTKGHTQWMGYQVHLTESCDETYPDVIIQLTTTAATTPDSVMGLAIQSDLADRDLLPATHLLDSVYVDAELMATAHSRHAIDVVAPPFASYSHQHRQGQGYGLDAFIVDWEAQQARCP